MGSPFLGVIRFYLTFMRVNALIYKVPLLETPMFEVREYSFHHRQNLHYRACTRIH
jgi:hypothetical protein